MRIAGAKKKRWKRTDSLNHDSDFNEYGTLLDSYGWRVSLYAMLFLFEDWCIFYLRQRTSYTFLSVFVCLCVCLSVCWQDYSKKRAWIWMKCCVSTDVGTWTNWLTFETDPNHSPYAGTGLPSPISYRLRNFAALPRLPASCAATRNSELRCQAEFYVGKFPPIRIGGAPLERAVVLKWFY